MKRNSFFMPPGKAGTAIVIGGTSGFGSAISYELHRRGFSLITVGRNNQSLAGVWRHYPCDVGDTKAWQSCVKQIVETTPPSSVQVLVYVVGYARVFPFDETPSTEWDRHFRLNFTYIAESFPHLQRLLCENAQVATTGSQWSYRHGWPDLIPYITAKHALASLTSEYAVTFSQFNFKHYCVPTMATKGYAAVRDSAVASHGSLHGFANPRHPADPAFISSFFVDHMLTSCESDKVVYGISPIGEIQTIEVT